MRFPSSFAVLIMFLFTFQVNPGVLHAQDDLESALDRAGANRAELDMALAQVPADERPGLQWRGHRTFGR